MRSYSCRPVLVGVFLLVSILGASVPATASIEPEIEEVFVESALASANPATGSGDRRITRKSSAVADAYVSQAAPNTAYAGWNIKMSDAAGAIQQGYVKFNLPDLPTNFVVASAQVKIFVTSANNSGIQIRGVDQDNSWTEGNLTWNNKPAFGGLLDQTGATVDLHSYTLDVTKDMQGQGNGIYSFAFKTNGGSLTQFAAKEHPDRPAAQLIVHTVYRAFDKTSYWNKKVTTLPVATATNWEPNPDSGDHPTPDHHPTSGEMIGYLKANQQSGDLWIKLNGAPNYASPSDLATGNWGKPFYFGSAEDWAYSTTAGNLRHLRNAPPASSCHAMIGPNEPAFELPTQEMHIPKDAAPDYDTSDSSITVFNTDPAETGDLPRAFGLWRACYDAAADIWYASGSDTYYLGSNGLHKDYTSLLPQYPFPNSGNVGHRGASNAVGAVRWAEWRAGGILHALHIAVRYPSEKGYYFPMTQTDADPANLRGPTAPPEGARIRLKQTINVDSLQYCMPAAKVILKALQTYGAVVADGAGANTNITVENTAVEDPGSERSDNLWLGPLTGDNQRGDDILNVDSLGCLNPQGTPTITFDDFEFVPLGARP